MFNKRKLKSAAHLLLRMKKRCSRALSLLAPLSIIILFFHYYGNKFENPAKNEEDQKIYKDEPSKHKPLPGIRTKPSASDADFANFPFHDFSRNCTVLLSTKREKPRTPYKVYIYNLPSDLNADLVKCIKNKQGDDGCFKLTHCGFGPRMDVVNDMVTADTWMFSSEVILHHKLLFSPYRTTDPMEADVFYVPYYASLACFCRFDADFVHNSIDRLFSFLLKTSYFQDGRPHVGAIGKIEREHASKMCQLLRHPLSQRITWIGIEQESNSHHRNYMGRTNQSFIVSPYPSYGHFGSTGSKSYLRALKETRRNILVFLAAGSRRSNHFRAKILDQFESSMTTTSYKSFKKHNLTTSNTTTHQVWLVTPECMGRHKFYTMDWMRHSVFCLQPPGDSPTRKSFYDSILSGCIPVLFEMDYSVKYPFQNIINYTDFTVTLDKYHIFATSTGILDILKTISEGKIVEMQTKLARVAERLQYSYPITDGEHDDAVQMILNEIQSLYKLGN